MDTKVGLVSDGAFGSAPVDERGEAAIVAETRAPGASVSVVARRHDLNANLLFKWNRQDEADELGGPLVATEALELVPIGVVGRTGDDGTGTARQGAGAPAGAMLQPVRMSSVDSQASRPGRA